MKIKELCLEDRPREKMLRSGAPSLSNSELLAILLRTGTKEHNVLEISSSLLAEAGGSLRGLAGFTPDRLRGICGIGTGKAATLAAALELGKRYVLEVKDSGHTTINSAGKVFDLMIPEALGLKEEHAWVLYLNKSNRLIDKEKISVGGLDSTTVDCKVIVRHALDKHAAAVILIHNHPSGNPRPGPADMVLTGTLRNALSTFSISLTDHVIITDSRFYSFADETVGEGLKAGRRQETAL